jgi:hypothetical protein
LSALLEIAQMLRRPPRMQELRVRVTALREDWPDALRMVLATVLSAAVARSLGLPESYWAVLSALIVSRPSSGGSAKAGAARLIGTVVGSAVAMAMIVARGWQIPEVALLAVAMVPLSLFVTAFEQYRTAPVAAIIILSSTTAIASPMHIALLRMLEITIGSLTSAIVAATVLPKRGHARPLRLGASIVARIGGMLERSFDPARDWAQLEASHDDVRRDLRDLGGLVRARAGTAKSAGAAKSTGVPRVYGRMAKLLGRLQADTMFVGRVVGGAETGADAGAWHLMRVAAAAPPGAGLVAEHASARQFAHSLHKLCRDLETCMLDFQSSQAPLQDCGIELKAAMSAYAAGRPVGAERPVNALEFLMDTLAKDLHDLVKLLQGAQGAAESP